jgi:hypothetical protein
VNLDRRWHLQRFMRVVVFGGAVISAGSIASVFINVAQRR